MEHVYNAISGIFIHMLIMICTHFQNCLPHCEQVLKILKVRDEIASYTVAFTGMRKVYVLIYCMAQKFYMEFNFIVLRLVVEP